MKQSSKAIITIDLQEYKMAFTTPELISMLNSKKSQERGIAARRIWTDWDTLEDIEAIKKEEKNLISLLKNETHERNIWHLMLVLGLLNSKDAVPIIINHLIVSKSENIRGFAADALSRYEIAILSSNTIQMLWKLIESDPSLVVRVNCIRACTNMYKGSKNSEISGRLFNLMSTQTHSAIITTILNQLGEIGSTAIVPDLVHIMITRRTEVDKKMAGLALDNIAKLNGYENRADLIKLIKGQN